jgi:hypothetical protein
MTTKLAIAVGIVFLLTIPVLGHHPFFAEFDWMKPVTLTGTVTMLEWENPHAKLHMDVKGADGKTQNWSFEMGSLSALKKAGWSKQTLKAGDTVTVDAWLAKSKSNEANMKSAKLANGRELSGASSIADLSASVRDSKPIAQVIVR